jgi:hypothetical protein
MMCKKQTQNTAMPTRNQPPVTAPGSASAPAQTSSLSMQDETYVKLDKILQDKKNQLSDYIKMLNQNAESVLGDEIMLNCFSIMDAYFTLQQVSPPPADMIHSMEELKNNAKQNYLRHYASFYDILFIDKKGDIFYTVRQQNDYKKNIFRGELAKTALSNELKPNTTKTFVDYQYYVFSGEPSAFIVIPVKMQGQFAGWIVFQCAINKINNMFTQDKDLGLTGEVFLVNKQDYMLTDSRFYGESSILNRKLSQENIESKFREKKGHKIVTDYRGFRVLSSFEVFDVGSSQWLIIAKIDEDEIITERYKKSRPGIDAELLDAFAHMNFQACSIEPPDKRFVEVDMDEYRKVQTAESIGTYGVSTCTAIVVTMPGAFAYMGHISNLDIAYGGQTTDIISHIMKQIKTFDILKYERRYLQVTVVANHFNSISNIINALVNEGLFLSQIKFIYNGSAVYAAVDHNYIDNETHITWLMHRNTNEKYHQCASRTESVGDVASSLFDVE